MGLERMTKSTAIYDANTFSYVEVFDLHGVKTSRLFKEVDILKWCLDFLGSDYLDLSWPNGPLYGPSNITLVLTLLFLVSLLQAQHVLQFGLDSCIRFLI
ncbi:hypothetical protein SLEP1_g45335 [Rubroshorea leprosula]|uniref:Uncharacterized protein n=1 Tax=Rubroshorea leprosula TaxID=152421 RepID=A0AAV5LJF9_9ROSI|nr:hypothetical protein SLEP1_g45335 [Rubroshorea leprosula]